MKAIETVLMACSLMILGGCDGGSVATEPDGPTPFVLERPPDFPIMEVPADNPLTEEGIDLGRQLFFDPILSIDSTVACASCHAASASFSDPNRFSKGVAGQTGRNSMPLMNLNWMTALFWDGRAESLEAQVLQPVIDPIEMGETWDHVVQKLTRHPSYPARFDAAFQTGAITKEQVARAIAQFERTLISAGSKFDRFRVGEASFTEQELLGLTLFNNEKGDCFHCHGAVLFTDNRFHNNGLDASPEDPGLAGVTGQPFDVGKFKTPTLRNVEYTAPYMHDGRFETLEAVIDFYDAGVRWSPTLDPLMRGERKLNLSDDEKAALVAFLKTLSDPDYPTRVFP